MGGSARSLSLAGSFRGLQGARLLELGAGCGLVSALCAQLGAAVTASDGEGAGYARQVWSVITVGLAFGEFPKPNLTHWRWSLMSGVPEVWMFEVRQS